MRKLVKLTFALLLPLFMTGHSYAQVLPPPPQTELNFRSPSRETNPNIQQFAPAISDQQAVNLAKRRYPGNILRISLIGEIPHRRYQIRMENEGKVFTVFVHATSGEVSRGG